MHASNTGNPTAVAALMKRRERLLRPLAKADGLVISDSDPADTGFHQRGVRGFAHGIPEADGSSASRYGVLVFHPCGLGSVQSFLCNRKFTLEPTGRLGMPSAVCRRLIRNLGGFEGLHYKGRYNRS